MHEDSIPENELDQLLIDAEDGIRQCTHLARNKNSGPRAFLIVAVADSSSLKEMIGQAGVVVSGYGRLIKRLHQVGLSETANQLVPPECGHYGVLLSASEDVRFGCSECDFEIVVEKAS